MSTGPVERVVLLDEDGRAIGDAPKAETHHADTPLHLAFSCYVFDASGRLLLSQRALDKATFPGVWTNSFCGHPAPGENVFEGLRRRAEQELGLAVSDVQLVLPKFRYQATMDNGVRENEFCPVFVAHTSGEPAPEPSEVEAVAWVPWAQFRDEVLAGTRDVSVWCALQVAELASRESDSGFITGSPDDLPPAVRETLPD